MLDPGRYLLGVAALAVLVGAAWLGATALRRRLTPELDRAPAQLATAVLALALLLLAAELLGSFGAFKPVPYLALVAGTGVGLWTLLPRVARWRGSPIAEGAAQRRPSTWGRAAATGPAGQPSGPISIAALAIAAAAVIRFALETKPHLSAGMTGFDSTWYHGPFAAGFFQSGDTWGLHFIAPQFLAWFYPANSEVFHAVGMLAFDRDVLSPLLNLGWFVGCLVAAWCIGRPYRVAPFSLALAALALSMPALSDQAGEARNDIVGIFFLLAAVAVTLNAFVASKGNSGLSSGALVVTGLAAGLAAGTKVNFLLPVGVLVLGLVVIAPAGHRVRAFATTGLAAVVGGGYWYLRNLIHTGNPLPWIKDVGPISLPAPDQALGGREGHSVFGYLNDGAVWSDWLLPGLHDGLTLLWPVVLALSLAGLLLCLGRRADPALRVAGLVGLAAAAAWLIAPTSASGPAGIPRGFESGLRYLAPALVLGLALLPTAPQLRSRASSLTSPFGAHMRPKRRSQQTRWGVGGALVLLAVGLGYPVQRYYLEHRYENPTFTTPGLNAAFAWSQGISDVRIATTSTRQYPLFSRDLSNKVTYIGTEQPHGGFTAPATCRQWRTLLNAGDYDYVVASRDRIEPGRPTYPATARWTQAPNAEVVLREPPTVIYKLQGPLDPSACP
jgi:hypothetical protein